MKVPCGDRRRFFCVCFVLFLQVKTTFMSGLPQFSQRFLKQVHFFHSCHGAFSQTLVTSSAREDQVTEKETRLL